MAQGEDEKRRIVEAVEVVLEPLFDDHQDGAAALLENRPVSIIAAPRTGVFPPGQLLKSLLEEMLERRAFASLSPGPGTPRLCARDRVRR